MDILLAHLITVAFIPVPYLIQCSHFVAHKSTGDFSPTSILLSFLFCTVNLAHVINIPYTFSAIECCSKRNLSGIECSANLAVVIQAGFVWFCNAILTIAFLSYHVVQKVSVVPIVAPADSERRILRLSWLLEPWTPSRSIIIFVCCTSTVVLIPFSVLFLAAVYPTNVSYWLTLGAWSYALNVASTALALFQGIPQIRKFSKVEKPTGISMVYLVLKTFLWFLLAGLWTTWFGRRIYANINFYIPMLWVVGAETWVNYAIAGVEDGILVLVMLRKRMDGGAEPQMSQNQQSRSREETVRQGEPDERTPLLGGS